MAPLVMVCPIQVVWGSSGFGTSRLSFLGVKFPCTKRSPRVSRPGDSYYVDSSCVNRVYLFSRPPCAGNSGGGLACRLGSRSLQLSSFASGLEALGACLRVCEVALGFRFGFMPALCNSRQCVHAAGCCANLQTIIAYTIPMCHGACIASCM